MTPSLRLTISLLSRTSRQVHAQPRIRPSSSPQAPYICARCLHSSEPRSRISRAPKTRDRGPASKEDTQTDFGAMNVLGNTPPPATGIDATTHDGFAFSNNTRVSGCGVLLLGGEVYKWRPWTPSPHVSPQEECLTSPLKNKKGQFEPDPSRRPWGLLEVIWPKPDLLIVGTGKGIVPLSPNTRRWINEMGVRIEVLDSRNAASQYNLLATERGIGQVAAALLPVGWAEKKA